MNNMVLSGRYIFYIIIITLFFNSCALNRMVSIHIIEPSIYEENGNRFIARQNGEYGYWIWFVSPTFPDRRPKVNFDVLFYSDNIIEQLSLESVSLYIEDLGINIVKDNINRPLKIIYKEETLSWQNPIAEESYSSITINDIFTDEIRDAISPKINMVQAYNKFKKVKKVQFTMKFLYKTNGEEKETVVVFNYETRRKTSIAWFDNIMGI